MAKWLFRDELQLIEINVPRAALHLARAVAYPDLNVAAYMSRLHDLSEEIVGAIDVNASPAYQAEQLSDSLFGRLGFSGDKKSYNDPRNSYLNEVIDRRQGIPITLSVLYIDIASRLGIPAYGIGLPGHFIVGIREADGDTWIDPFHDGRRLDLTDCAELIRLASGYEGPLEAGWFAPVSARATLARMLNNLRAAYVASSSWPQAADVIQLLREVQPHEAEHLRDLGLVYYHQHHLPQAAHFLNAYLQRTPDAPDAQTIRDGVKPILDEWVPMN
ncbi:MAG: transglutaminase family protein [Anaerolineales bacterium]|uniref:SirB1 family protein n=1 Tax=Promineifilum sp. TaxID=2664178 RepID=UPI001E093AA1|nr:transglutaminase family protein [Anaerolineales bacterium]MCB8934911.1 tetratricopeptide repeat protein [Promineifilum sp.]MCO5178486.1 transglutaminase-like domain-containing protein [Promineifilum sp.]